MNKKKQALVAYSAGVIDVIGSFSIDESSVDMNEKHLLITVGNCDGKILDFLKGNFGGTIRSKTDGLENDSWSWCLTGLKTIKFLKTLLPFLRSKKKQAELAIRYETRILVAKRKEKSGTLFEFSKRAELKEMLEKEKRFFQKPKGLNPRLETKQIEG